MAKSKSRPKKGVADKVRMAKLAKAKNVFTVQTNPFEVKINKQKHKILGRKTKHDRGLPGVSRSKANKKRKDTLLNEYKKRHNTNVVVDERFGEGDTNLSVEEKMLQRFAIEKKRKHEKMSLFNLNDEEEELTHYGQSLASIQDFGGGDESDDGGTGEIAGEYVAEAHFGGGIFRKVNRDEESEKKEGDAPKSRKEVIEEIIMKSKKAKLEKQTARDEANELREKLDNTWQEVEKLLKSSTRTKRDREIAKESFEPDAYDVAVKQMQFDKKAAPAPRGKSEAELAAERKENLRRLEDERLERMKGSYGGAARKPTHRSADDLNYDFLPEKITVEPVRYKDGVMVGAEPLIADDKDDGLLEPELLDENAEDGGDEEEHGSESQDRDEEEGPESDDADDDFSDIFSDEETKDSDDEASDEDEDEQQEEEEEDRVKGKAKRQNVEEKTKNIQSFPESYEDFDNHTKTKYAGNTDKYVSYLRRKFSAELAKGNKGKLQKLFQYLWQCLYNLHTDETPQKDMANTMVRHLYELCQGNPKECASFVLDELRSTYNECLTRGGKMKIPDFGNIMQFKLIKILFSTSDFFHPVATSAMIFMCHMLQSSRPSNLSELATCLFICTLLYEYVSFSRRFVPECLNYLCAAICMAVPKAVQRAKGLPAAASLHLNSKNCELLVLKGRVDDIVVENEKPDLMKLLKSREDEIDNADIVRVQLLATTLKLSLKFVRLYSQMPCFREVHAPLKAACARCIAASSRETSKKHPSAELLYEVQAEIQRLVKKRPHLERLVKVEDNRPKALPLYDPKFEDIKREPFSKGGKNVSAAKRERSRLQHKYKREMKGAVREIKKDARFLAREQLKEQMEKDQERAEKVKRLYGFLSNQEGEVKKINRKRFKLGT